MPEADEKRKRAHGLLTRQALLVAAGTVFSRVPYADARLKDIADEAGISQGSLYFHFGNKADVAKAVLEEQQARMAGVLLRVTESERRGLERLIRLFSGLAELVATDELVQAGIRLAVQPAIDVEDEARTPYASWVLVAAEILRDGVEDRSVSGDVPIGQMAELLNEVFVGAQTLAGLEDKWASLPARVRAAEPMIRLLLSPQREHGAA